MDFEIRADRDKSQGFRRLVRERAAYLQLVRERLSNEEACRIVGINARTGRRWANGPNACSRFKAAPPSNAVVPPLPSVPGRYLSEGDRIHTGTTSDGESSTARKARSPATNYEGVEDQLSALGLVLNCVVRTVGTPPTWIGQ
ncbi:helix-turn-helix domain-containing protein [Nocardia sp. NBC_00403]|uniref:helix-turn-helix domain-containing protein n=1 Tax=Nocardia sp. NBC_00403 TaxID=2975990 RepID=UPI003FA5246E